VNDPGFLRWMPDESHDVGMLRRLDDDGHEAGFVPAAGGLLDGLQGSDVGSSLHLLMEPEDIATVPGLPQHVYDDAARYARGAMAKDPSGVPAAMSGQPDEYVSRLDQVSLAPRNLNPSGLDLPVPATQLTDNQSKADEKYEKGAKAAEYLEKGIDWWNGQNKILGLHFGPEGPEMLEKYTGPAGKGLVAVENGLKAGGEIANGAPALPTIAGAGIKTGSTLGAMGLGMEGGGALGFAVGGPVGSTIGGVAGGILGGLAPDWVYGNMSNQQIGEAAGHMVDDAGRSYDRYVIRNPYYDPRLMMP